jgi:plastocyanin
LSSRLEAAAVAVALISVGLLTLVAPVQASAPGAPVVATGAVRSFTLYGSALSGWGFGANNTTNPGPHLAVQYGDTVQLTLISLDGATVNHNWFIDYTNTSVPSSGEPSSPTFSQGNSIVWNFTANRVGTFVYRCEVHPSSMMGLITITAPTHYTLYGNALLGWGFNATALSSPGPTLIVAEGVNVTLTLYSVDGTFHTWFIDYDNSTSVTSGETPSPEFGASGNPNPLNYTFNATRAGTFAYRCSIHLTTMWGMIVVLGSATNAPSGGFPIGLIPGIMLVVIVGVLGLAAIYQVRATRAARMKK